MTEARKPPVGRLVVKHKDTGYRCELGCLWENRFSGNGNFDVSFYKQDERRPEGQMDRMSLQTFADQGGPESYYVSHWRTNRTDDPSTPGDAAKLSTPESRQRRRDEDDVPF